MLNLADVCHQRNIHLTTYATGCIFHYDKDFPEGSGKGFKEGDTPNFTGSYYSYTKARPSRGAPSCSDAAQGHLRPQPSSLSAVHSLHPDLGHDSFVSGGC